MSNTIATSKIEISEKTDGCELRLRVQPGARQGELRGEYGGALKIAVAAPPEDGRANDAVIELLSKILNVATSQIELLSGRSSRNKRILVRGLNSVELIQRLESKL